MSASHLRLRVQVLGGGSRLKKDGPGGCTRAQQRSHDKELTGQITRKHPVDVGIPKIEGFLFGSRLPKSPAQLVGRTGVNSRVRVDRGNTFNALPPPDIRSAIGSVQYSNQVPVPMTKVQLFNGDLRRGVDNTAARGWRV